MLFSLMQILDLVGINQSILILRSSAKRWEVYVEDVFWEARIIEDEEDINLPGERKVERYDYVAFVADALSDKDCEFKFSPNWSREEAYGEGKSLIVCASISNGVGRSITI